MCDWEDPEGFGALVDALVRGGYAALRVLEGRELSAAAEAADLLATVIGQDVDTRDDDTLAIARRVAGDRVVCTVDPEARHGHESSARRYESRPRPADTLGPWGGRSTP